MINLNDFKKKIYSQFGEDGITEKIFELIGSTNKVCVEFGVEDGVMCCSRILWQKHNFKQILFDMNHENEKINLKKCTVTVHNILQLFDENNVPEDLDFLSVDIDSYDFYVLTKILEKYYPRVLVVETNPTFKKDDKVIMLNHKLNDGAYHGASLKAWVNLLEDKYDLVCHENSGINAFFVKKNLLNGDIIENINNFDLLHNQHPDLHNYAPYPENYPILSSKDAQKLVKKQKFTYYTIIGKDLNLLKGHLDNIKMYAGFDSIQAEKEIIVIVYKNKKIPEETTNKILKYCDENHVKTVIFNETTDNFLENLYACWNLGYEKADEGYVFRGGSDQVFSKNSFSVLYEIAEKIRTTIPEKKVILQANTIECESRIKLIGANSRHFTKDFGYTFDTFNYTAFEDFINSINKSVKEKILSIEMALKYWGKPTQLEGKLGILNRTDGCSWLMTKQDWINHGPIPPIENYITGDVIIHDRFMENGYENYIVRDCVTYHFVQGERT